MSWVPARVGDSLADVDTPALVVDLDALERNLERMASFVRGTAVRVRPHAKSHKCLALAKLQVAHGAVGLCAQKLGEAEPLIRGGIGDVLITNEIVGAAKLARLAELAVGHPRARVGVCVDDATNVAALGAACSRAGARVDVYVEIDVGQRRAGVATAEEAVALAHAIANEPSLALRGLHAYHGAAQHLRTVPERRAAIAAASERAGAAKRALVAARLSCDVVTGAGTGTYPYEIASGVYDEIQPGSYVLMDVDYAKNELDPDAPSFEPALFVLATVMSRRDDRATLDAGTKAQSVDCGPAQPAFAGWRVRGVYDEHAVLDRDGADGGPTLALGEKIRLVPGHVDPTVNLHDWFVVVRGERVVDVWPIEGRGRFD